jgi:hypothetical protein
VLALNYGYRTPVSVVLSHIAYGVILGVFYRTPDEREHKDFPIADLRW